MKPLVIALAMMVGFIVMYDGNAYPIFEGESSTMIIDEYPPSGGCNNNNLPKGILSSWFFDLNGDGFLTTNENIFYGSAPIKRDYGNYIYLNFINNRGVRYSMFQRCFTSKIVNYTNNTVIYTLPYGVFNITYTYKFHSMKNYTYYVKKISSKTTSYGYVYRFDDVFSFPYWPQSKNRLIDFEYIFDSNIKMRVYNHLTTSWCPASNTKYFPLSKSNPVYIQHKRYILGIGTCYTGKNKSLEIYINKINTCESPSFYVFRIKYPLLINRYVYPNKKIEDKIIYTIIRRGTNYTKIMEDILTQECDSIEKEKYVEEENKDQRVSINIDNTLPLFDFYSGEGITLSKILNMKYTTKKPQREQFYYIHNSIYYPGGIPLTKEDLISIAKQNNITIISSCNNEQAKLLSISYAYNKGFLYVEDYKKADKYLCENVFETYFKEFKDNIYGIILINSSLPWKNYASMLSYKAMPYIINETKTIKENIRDAIDILISNNITQNPYFKRYGLFMILLGNETFIPFSKNKGIKSDIEYGFYNEDEYVDFAVGRITHPIKIRDKFKITSAILMSEYEQPTDKAFFNRYNGMFTSLIALTWLKKYDIETTRFVERKVSWAVFKETVKSNFESIASIVALIKKGKVIAASSLIGALYAIFKLSTVGVMIVHEIDYSFANSETDISDIDNIMLAPLLDNKAFYNIKNHDFFGYFGRIKNLSFIYPDVDLTSFNYKSFEGMFYLDSSFSYEMGKELHKYNSFGYAYIDKIDNRKAQERIGHILRSLLVNKDNIGNALKDSTNILISQKSLLAFSNHESEIYSKVLLGDPSVVLEPPLRKTEYENKNLEEIRQQAQYRVLSLNIKSNDSINSLLNKTQYISIIKEWNFNYSLVEYIFSDYVEIPTLKIENITLEAKYTKINDSERINVSVISSSCSYTYNKEKTIKNTTKIYVHANSLCLINTTLHYLSKVKMKILYSPEIEIINHTIEGKNISAIVYSNANVTTNIYGISDGKIVYNKKKTLYKGINKISIELNNLEIGKLTVVIGNSYRDITIPIIPSLKITEIFPNPYDEELEFIEVYYEGELKGTYNFILNETSLHKFSLNLSKGFYILSKNKSKFMDVFDIEDGKKNRIIEIPSLRLNNNGETISIIYNSMVLDKRTYKAKPCIRNEECSYNVANFSTIYTFPNPFNFPTINSSSLATPEKKNTTEYFDIVLPNNKIYKGHDIKIKIKKNRCSWERVEIKYSLNNTTGIINEIIYCSKTIKIPGINLEGRHIVDIIVSNGNITENTSFKIEILGEKSLICDLSLNLIPYGSKVDIDKEIYFDIIVNDRVCQSISHPLILSYWLEDKEKNKIIKEKETRISLTCNKKISKKIRINEKNYKRIKHQVLYLKTSIKYPGCLDIEMKNNLASKELFFIGKMYKEDKEKEVKKSSQTKTSDTFVVPTNKNLEKPTEEKDRQVKNSKPVSIKSIILDKEGIIYVEIVRNDTQPISIYSYIGDGKGRLFSYYCDNGKIIKGWKANIKHTKNKEITLKMCLKDNIPDQGIIKIKFSYDNDTFEEIAKPMDLSIFYNKNRKTNNTKITNKEYTYRCIYDEDKTFIEIFPSRPLKITYPYKEGNKTIYVEEKSIINSHIIYINNNETVWCTEIKKEKSIINKILSVIKSLFSFLF